VVALPQHAAEERPLIVGMPKRRFGMNDLDPNQILSPSRDQLGQETDMLLARIAQTGHDYFASDVNDVTQDLLGRWDAFVSEVTNWDAGPRIITHLLGTTWRDETIAYQQKYNGFRNEFINAGVGVTSPAFTFTAAAPTTLDKLINQAGGAADKVLAPLKAGLGTIETVAIVGSVVAAAWIFYLTFETGRTARHVGAELLK
jgi:hypothetical protein